MGKTIMGAPFALSWSGGKDSALAMWTLRGRGLEPDALITTVTEPYERISMHGVRRELLARLAAAGKRGLFPLWGRNTGALAREFLAVGFEAMLVCVDPRALDASFCGRRYDDELLSELPDGVDPCG